ncbi:hypothetical protein GW7_08474 [Heterocephalus glaber]|uniref:Immunoglobulin V-set domain-containing protein n=1 Tax=Heterocephalus glaber TaxID=10181 RepID=G5BFR9_HETGA|nr:hypothetical protein GW7_08474 [Heterocephalus glaber]
MIIIDSTDSKRSGGRYTVTPNATVKHFTASQLSDSGSYICVVGALCSLGTWCLYPNLHLEVSRRLRRWSRGIL